jgi:cell division protease FtsH
MRYLVLFGIFTVQDRLNAPALIAYTEFKSQVPNQNVAAVFARGYTIEEELKKAAPLPDKADRTDQQFTTVRHPFAGDDRRQAGARPCDREP